MNNFVIDTSVAVKWFIPEEDSDLARHILDLANAIYAPDHLLIEFDNVFCRHARSGRIPLRHVQEIRAAVRCLPFEFARSTQLSEHAFNLAMEIGDNVQDCLYLALAFHRDALLLTADVAFHRRIMKAGFGNRARLLSQGV